MMNAPQEMSTGILFSMIRKDGMLLFNMNQGSLLQIMPLKSVFLLVLFSSTFSACSVTIIMIIKNLGGTSRNCRKTNDNSDNLLMYNCIDYEFFGGI